MYKFVFSSITLDFIYSIINTMPQCSLRPDKLQLLKLNVLCLLVKQMQKCTFLLCELEKKINGKMKQEK